MTGRCYRSIIFDVDGTLLDYEKSSGEALTETLKYYGFNGNLAIAIDRYKEINNWWWKQMEQGLCKTQTLRVERFRQLFDELNIPSTNVENISKKYLSFLSSRADFLPYALSILKWLKGKYHLGLITNGISEVQRSRITISGIADYIRDITISDEEGCSKPNHEIFEIAVKKSHLSKKHILYVGDSISSDMAGANNAGIDFCWYNPDNIEDPQNHHYKFNIQSLDELKTIL